MITSLHKEASFVQSESLLSFFVHHIAAGLEQNSA